MKINLEIDCTPNEAREFFGLPDLRPMQAAVLARIEAQLLEAASSFSPEGVLKLWFNAMPQASVQYFESLRRLLDRETPKA